MRYQCLVAEIPFFFKQWGGFNKKKTGRLLDDRKWDDMPVVAGKERIGFSLFTFGNYGSKLKPVLS